MKNIQKMVSLAAIFVLAILVTQNASAFASIDDVEVNGVDALNGAVNIGAFSGDSLPVRVTFTATADAQDARIKIWLAGEKDNAVSSERFDVLNGSTYSRLVSVAIPVNVDYPSEEFQLEIQIENRNDGAPASAYTEVQVTAQRESYTLEVLDVNLGTKAVSGEAMPVDIVLKNRGSHLAEDTFVKVRIPALGVEQRAYFGDLSATDQSDPDKEDAVERRMFVNIPKSAPAGVYTVEVEAYNADSDETVSKKIAIVGASEDTSVVSTAQSKTFAAGETKQYSITLVNSGNRIRVYELVPEVSDNLNVEMDESIVAVNAGTSKTVKINVVADKAGEQSFAVNVYSDGELVNKQTFSANVQGSTGFKGGSTTLVLTVVLAIIFVVLLVVLIVLLTRKPEKTDELGENYY